VYTWPECDTEPTVPLSYHDNICAELQAEIWRLRLRIAAMEEFTRARADELIAEPKRHANLLTMSEPTAKLGGDRAR